MAVDRRHFMTTAAALGGAVLLAPPGTAQALSGAAVPGGSGIPDYEPTRASLDTHPVPRWFKDAKFGIFIHWGAYSVPAGAARQPAAEWYLHYMNWRDSPEYEYHRGTYGENFNYDDFIPQFKAEKYDPDAWVRLFEDAGAQYFVLTSKHHDGFALFPSAVTDRHSVRWARSATSSASCSPPPASEAPSGRGCTTRSASCTTRRSAGRCATRTPAPEIPPAGYLPVADYVRDYEHKQLHEIIDRYDPDLLWADGQWAGQPPTAPWHSEEPMAYYYNQAKNRQRPKGVAINDRFDTHQDFATYEQHTAPVPLAEKWEHCVTIGYSWGYNKHELPEDYKTSEFLVHRLVDVVSKNGNLLLNIGPKPTARSRTSCRSGCATSAPGSP